MLKKKGLIDANELVKKNANKLAKKKGLIDANENILRDTSTLVNIEPMGVVTSDALYRHHPSSDASSNFVASNRHPHNYSSSSSSPGGKNVSPNC